MVDGKGLTVDNKGSMVDDKGSARGPCGCPGGAEPARWALVILFCSCVVLSECSRFHRAARPPCIGGLDVGGFR
eukprot:1874213-Pyramimonas_sp.AAC.3